MNDHPFFVGDFVTLTQEAQTYFLEHRCLSDCVRRALGQIKRGEPLIVTKIHKHSVCLRGCGQWCNYRLEPFVQDEESELDVGELI